MRGAAFQPGTERSAIRFEGWIFFESSPPHFSTRWRLAPHRGRLVGDLGHE